MQSHKKMTHLLVYACLLALSVGFEVAQGQETPNQYRVYTDKQIDCKPCIEVMEKELSATAYVERVDVYADQGLVIINMSEGAEMDHPTVEGIFRLAKLKMKDFERSVAAD